MDEYEEWLESRPQIIKDLVAKCPPTRAYGMTNDGAKYAIYSYLEDGTINVIRFENWAPPVKIFGVRPEDLYLFEG